MPATVRIYEATDEDRQVVLPITPTELSDSGEALTRDYTLAGSGSYSTPNGRTEQHFPFTGRLPGASRKYLPHVHDWRGPSAIMHQIRQWINGTSLRLEFDGLAGQLNRPVFLKRYAFRRTGGYGDVDYDVEFVELRVPTVTIDTGAGTEVATSGEAVTSGGADAAAADHAARELPAPAASPSIPATYTVRPGDTLSLIARLLLGDASRWREIWHANPLPDPNTIYPGLVLVIPGGEAPTADASAPNLDLPQQPVGGGPF